MTPGRHTHTTNPLEARRSGLQIRDTVLVLLPGPRLLPVTITRAPPEGTLGDNVLRHGAGGIDVDSHRVGTSTRLNSARPRHRSYVTEGDDRGRFWKGVESTLLDHGRWPPNVLIVHAPSCSPAGSTRIRGSHPVGTAGRSYADRDRVAYGRFEGHAPSSHVNPDGTETAPAWLCPSTECPAKALDEQGAAMGSHPVGTAIRRVGPGSCKGYYRPNALGAESRPEGWTGVYHNDSGTVSRFFPQLDSPDDAQAWLATLTGTV